MRSETTGSSRRERERGPLHLVSAGARSARGKLSRAIHRAPWLNARVRGYAPLLTAGTATVAGLLETLAFHYHALNLVERNV